MIKYFKNILMKNNFISDKIFSRMRKHWVRVVPDEKIIKYLNEINHEILTILEISGENWRTKFFSKKYTSLSYQEFDIEKDREHSEKYDLIILEHVLEHVSNPYSSLVNLFNLLNPGGHLIVVTPFLIKIHPSPIDCTRWTALGLSFLLEDVGFKKGNIKVGQWGNKSAVKANFKKWVKYNPLLHSLRNEENFPAVVWGFAKKNN
jgi:SAM-dependent methyltransferase